MNKTYLNIGAITLSLFLISCEKTKEQFDFSRKAPDEFAVIRRAPLEMPPDYNLRPPAPGTKRPQEKTATEQAQTVIIGDTATTSRNKTEITKGEAILLQKAGADRTDPNIRKIVDEETKALAEKEKPTIDRILGIAGKKYEPPAKTVNPVEEVKRIRKEKSQ